MTDIRNVASQNIEKEARYEIAKFQAKKATVHPLKEGDFVVRMIEPRVSTKLSPKFKGMYRIVEVLNNDRYRLQNLVTNKICKYPHERVRKITEDDLVPQLIEDPSEDEEDQIVHSGPTGNEGPSSPQPGPSA